MKQQNGLVMIGWRALSDRSFFAQYYSLQNEKLNTDGVAEWWVDEWDSRVSSGFKS